MEYTYEEVTTDFGTSIKRTDEDGVVSWIPVDEANSDYRTYVDSEGNK